MNGKRQKMLIISKTRGENISITDNDMAGIHKNLPDFPVVEGRLDPDGNWHGIYFYDENVPSPEAVETLKDAIIEAINNKVEELVQLQKVIEELGL